MPIHVLLCLLFFLIVEGGRFGMGSEPFRVEVVDSESGWPVPLVEFRTTHAVSLVTDNAGLIAIDLPELMNRETWFFVRSDGYGVAADGFGYEGVRLRPEPGGKATVGIERRGIARRLGRLTGAGLFSESQKLGERCDWKESGVFGCDSIQVAAYRGRTFWIWGDTRVARYPLGIFDASCATTSQKPLPDPVPPLAVSLDYFRNEKGQIRGVADLEGDGPTWLSAMVTLPDRDGRERLVASYAKIKPPLTAYRKGLCEWDDERERFESILVVSDDSEGGESAEDRPMPDGHPCFWTGGEGRRWVLFGNPFPTLKVGADYESWRDPTRWITVKQPDSLPMDPRSGEGEVVAHSGSIDWCPNRGRWIALFVEKFGEPSPLGEVWVSEANSPFGPWEPAVKVLSHRNYTFYNPRLRFDLVPEGADFILFEGTYTNTFSGNPVETERYDYNQLLYRIDYADLRREGE